MNHRVILWLACVGLLASACGRPSSGASAEARENVGVTNKQPTAPPPRALGPVQGIDPMTVDELAQSWCDHQRGCDRVGPDKQYAAFDACMTQMRGTVGDDLGAFHCPRGFDSEQTRACMAEIQHADCSLATASLPALGECRGEVLCAK